MVPELNDLHGKSLACHSFCLAIGFGLLAFSQFRQGDFIEGFSQGFYFTQKSYFQTNMTKIEFDRFSFYYY